MQSKISSAETSISSLSNAQTSLINKMAAKPITIENPFASANAIQVQIDDNIRILAELHARWEREDEIARNNKMNVCTITPTSNTETPSANTPSTTNAKIVNEEKPTFSTKSLKLSNLFLISVLKFFKVEEILLLLLIITSTVARACASNILIVHLIFLYDL